MVLDLWGAKIPTFNSDALVSIHHYEHVLESLLGLAISSEYMQALMREHATATLEHM